MPGYIILEMENLMEQENKIKACRWLFYITLFQTAVFFIVPVFLFPAKLILYLEIMAAMTLGVIFALFFLGVNIYGFFIDKGRRWLYLPLTVFLSGWIVWAVVSWAYIEHMDYLLN